MYNVSDTYCDTFLTPKGALENLMSVHLSVYKFARAFFLNLYIYAHNRARSMRPHQQRECLSETPTLSSYHIVTVTGVRARSLLCADCGKAVCAKCGVETSTLPPSGHNITGASANTNITSTHKVSFKTKDFITGSPNQL